MEYKLHSVQKSWFFSYEQCWIVGSVYFAKRSIHKGTFSLVHNQGNLLRPRKYIQVLWDLLHMILGIQNFRKVPALLCKHTGHYHRTHRPVWRLCKQHRTPIRNNFCLNNNRIRFPRRCHSYQSHYIHCYTLLNHKHFERYWSLRVQWLTHIVHF